MDSILFWLMAGVAGLLLSAGAVAVWEHLWRSVRPEEEFTSATPKAVSIDLRLDRLTAQPTPAVAPAVQPPGDIEQRRAALDDVLARLAQPAADEPDSPRYWAETTPMVAPGQLDPQEPAVTRRPGQFSPSQL